MATKDDIEAAAANGSAAKEQIQEAISSADTVASERIQGLQQIHQARLAQAMRVAGALKARYGGDDPRVQTADAAVTSMRTAVSRVSILREQMGAPSVQVTKTGWALQGRVLDAQLQPAARFTVFLVDAKKSYLQQYGFAYTDDTGYFVLNYAGDTAGAAAPAAAAAPQLFVEIANTQGNPVYLSPTPFQPVLGATSFENIVLPAGRGPIGDPPPEIRKIALPRTGTQRPKGSNPDSAKKQS
jgi:hypothetical protein